MAKIRVYELAKQLDISSKDVVTFMASKGVTVTAQNGLEDDQAQQVRKAFASSSSQKDQNVVEKNNEEKNKQKEPVSEGAENKQAANASRPMRFRFFGNLTSRRFGQP